MAYKKDRIRIQIEGKEFSVVGGDFSDMLASVKQINGRRFLGELKVWQLPGTVADVQDQLEISGYGLEGGTPIADASPPAAGQTPPAASAKDRIRVRIAGQQLSVTGGSFQEMLAMVKNLPGRRYDGESKIWEIPGDVDVIQGMIQATGFELEGAEKVSSEPVPDMELPLFADAGEPPPFEPPDFSGADDSLPFVPPDWLDDDNLPPPPEPPDWWDDEQEPPTMDQLDNEPNWDDMPMESDASSTAPATPTPAPAQKSGGDRIRVRIGGIPMVVSGGTFKEMLAVIKELPERRFDGQDKVWDIPAEVGLKKFTEIMNGAGFDVGRG